MAEFPALPLWTDAFLADTTHLSRDEIGAYLLLLMAAWRSEDCSVDQPSEPYLREMFVLEGDRCIVLPGAPAWRHADWLLHPSRIMGRVWPVIRRVVLDTMGEKCRYCGTEEGPFDIDHIIPRCQGGTNDFRNLTVACAPRNRSKNGRTPEQWLGAR